MASAGQDGSLDADNPATPALPGIAKATSALHDAIAANPNNLQLAEPLQALLAHTRRAPDVCRVLFDWYLRTDTQPQVRGVLVMLILTCIRPEAAAFDPALLGVDTRSPRFKAMYRGMPHYLDAAIDTLQLLTRLQSGSLGVAMSPKFIVAIPKSGSSLLGMCLGNMLKLTRGKPLDNSAFEWRGYPSWWDLGVTQDWDLRPEIAADRLFRIYPGGVYKGHIPPSDKNLSILNLYPDSRYVIILRDPRDQIVAQMCQALRFQPKEDGQTDAPLAAAEVHDRLDTFMASGHLIESLSFMAKWLAVRDPDRSIVVTYDELMADPLTVMRQMAVLYELNLTDAQMQQVYQYAAPYTQRVTGYDKTGLDRRIYPLGWTGEPCIWQTYFSAGNIATFDRIFRGFCDATSWAAMLQETFPSLTTLRRAA